MNSKTNRKTSFEKNGIEKLKFLSTAEVRSLVKTYGTPIFVYDEKAMLKNMEYMNTLPHTNGLTIRFSIKSQPNRFILRLFNSRGIHFDASSEWEVKRALRAGIDAQRILLTSQEFGDGVPKLIEAGIQFDAGSLHQLETYGKLFPNTDVSIRINPGFGSGLVNRLTSGGPNSSFGIWHEEKDKIKRLLNKYNLNLIRLHTHIGSGHNPEILLACLNKILEFSVFFGHVPIINLGGGYRVQAFKSDIKIDHVAILKKACQKISEYEKKYNKKVKLELEPGTFMVANTGSIISKIIDIVHTGKQGHTFIKINSGLTEIIRPSYYGAQHPLVVVPKSKSNGNTKRTHQYCVAGHCCIAGDVLTTETGEVERLAPQTLQHATIGDFLVIERGGGYCASMSLKNFNSYPESAEVIRRTNGEFQLIRKRQDIEQICQNEI